MDSSKASGPRKEDDLPRLKVRCIPSVEDGLDTVVLPAVPVSSDVKPSPFVATGLSWSMADPIIPGVSGHLKDGIASPSADPPSASVPGLTPVGVVPIEVDVFPGADLNPLALGRASAADSKHYVLSKAPVISSAGLDLELDPEVPLPQDGSSSSFSSTRMSGSIFGPVRCGKPVGFSSVSAAASQPVLESSRIKPSTHPHSQFQISPSNFPPLPSLSNASSSSADVAHPTAFSASPCVEVENLNKSSTLRTSPVQLSPIPRVPSPRVSLPKDLDGSTPVDFDAERKIQASWASKVKDLPAAMDLKFIKPMFSDVEGKIRIKLPASVAHKGASIWHNTIVGFFLDKLPYSLVSSCAMRHWGKAGLTDVLCNGNGYFFFKFSVSANVQDVLEGGPWHFGGRPIFLRRWSPGLNLSKDGCKKVPIWAHFFNIPLEYWTEEGLSYIASMVGKPLHADKMTSTHKRLSYARICIEIDIDASLPNAFDLELDDGSCAGIIIEYNWIPKRCSVCKEFGHLPSKCKRVTHQVWIPKAPQPPSKPDSVGDWQLVGKHRSDVPISPTTSLPNAPCDVPVSLSLAGSSSMDPPRKISSASVLDSSVNSFAALCSLEARHVSLAEAPIAPGVGPIGSGPDDPTLVDDPVISRTGDMIAADGPVDFDNLTDLNVPIATCSVPPAGDSSVSPPPSLIGEVSSPSSSPSSTPSLARRINMIDEVEKKLGRKMKDKKKMVGRSGKSRGKISLISND